MFLAELQQQVSSLDGIGPAASKNLARLGIFSIADLLSYWPRTWQDRRKWQPISSFNQVSQVQTICKVLSHTWFGYGRMKTLKIEVEDFSGRAFLICFNRGFLEQQLPVGALVSVVGAFFLKYGELQSSAFEAKRLTLHEERSSAFELSERGIPLQKSDSFPGGAILPVYSLKAGITQAMLRKTMHKALSLYAEKISSEIPQSILESRNLFSKSKAIIGIHEPQTQEELDSSKQAIMYEELFHFQYAIALRAFLRRGSLPKEADTWNIKTEQDSSDRQKDDSEPKHISPLSPLQKRLIESLPFELTADQQKVLAEINCDIDSGEETTNFQMSRLLQGDVGSGKTLVAFLAGLRIIDMGGQVALVAPTELLARQHAENAAKLVEPLGVRLAFLSGNIKATGRGLLLLQALLKNEVQFVIGTHALFSTGVKYFNLKLAIIDEQHRFGVLQRNAITQKGKNTHLLMMSATPIPRTLALTVFGDLDVSIIRSMPKGRKPIITHLATEKSEQRVYDFVRRELQAGRQAYFVYPLIAQISDADTENYPTDEKISFEFEEKKESIKSAEEMFYRLQREIYPDFSCALIHSKIGEIEQKQIMQDFHDKKVQVLVATSVVEVGVDNPNATIMVIEHADRFGLSALHQLRGRVGRGSAQSYCFLLYGAKLTEDGKARLRIMHEQTDGFVIAEEDLNLRGPGHATGIQQSGYLKLGLADPVEQRDLLLLARHDAFELIKNDYGLALPQNKILKDLLERCPPFRN